MNHCIVMSSTALAVGPHGTETHRNLGRSGSGSTGSSCGSGRRSGSGSGSGSKNCGGSSRNSRNLVKKGLINYGGRSGGATWGNHTRPCGGGTSRRSGVRRGDGRCGGGGGGGGDGHATTKDQGTGGCKGFRST